MGYRGTDYDPDYDSEDFPPPTPRKKRWYLINYLMALLLLLAAPLKAERWFILSLIWGGAAVSAAFGVIINPNITIFEEDDPKDFWISYAILLAVSIGITWFILADESWP